MTKEQWLEEASYLIEHAANLVARAVSDLADAQKALRHGERGAAVELVQNHKNELSMRVMRLDRIREELRPAVKQVVETGSGYIEVDGER